jgi:hypothetical protein
MNPAHRVQDLELPGNVDKELHAVHSLPTCMPKSVVEWQIFTTYMLLGKDRPILVELVSCTRV